MWLAAKRGVCSTWTQQDKSGQCLISNYFPSFNRQGWTHLLQQQYAFYKMVTLAFPHVPPFELCRCSFTSLPWHYLYCVFRTNKGRALWMSTVQHWLYKVSEKHSCFLGSIIPKYWFQNVVFHNQNKYVVTDITSCLSPFLLKDIIKYFF